MADRLLATIQPVIMSRGLVIPIGFIKYFATALTKVADLLRFGAWWVMVWNDFGDPDRADSFHDATTELLNGPSTPSRGDSDIPFSQDKEILDPDQVVRLYATYSNINIRLDREAILTELGRIARDEFQGVVTHNMTTSLYMARRNRHLPALQ